MNAPHSEVWKDVSGFEGAYQVSDQGGLRSCSRWVRNPTNGGYWQDGRPLKPRCDKDGYLIADFWKSGVKTTVKVHRLVALAFLQPSPGCPEVDHINGNRADNRLENLRWVSSRQNKLNTHVCKGRSGIRGVCYRAGRRNPWQAYKNENGVFKSLGHYVTRSEAVNARNKYIKEAM